MTTYTDVFGNDTLPPSQYGYQALSISANTTLVWPYNTSGGTAVSKIIDLTATVGSLSLTTPDATQVSTGEDFLIRNVGAQTVTLKDPGGATIGTVAAGAASYFYLTDNSTEDGVYGVIAYGVGTSSVDAATLVGYGLMASGSTLNAAFPVTATGSGLTIDATYRAKLLEYTGGADTLALTAAATLGDNFFFMLNNQGTGTLTINPNASELIDGATTLSVQPGESMMVCCSGVAFYTVGRGRSVFYNFTQLVKDLTAGGTIALSSVEASNKLIKFIGTPGAGVTVEVPAVVAVYYVFNDLSTAQSVTVKTNLGSGSTITQTARAILFCDGTDVFAAQSVIATTSIQLINGSAAAPALNFASQTNTGLYKYSTTGWGMSVNGSASLTHDGTTATLTATSFDITGTITSGTWHGSTIGVAYGGTGQTSYTNGQLLIGNTTGNTLTKATLTAGSNISITNGTGSIAIAATGLVTALGSTSLAGASTNTNVYTSSDALGRAQSVLTYDDPGTRADNLQGYAQFIQATPTGIAHAADSGGDADYGHGISVQKLSYTTTTVKGSVGGQQVVALGGYFGATPYNAADGEVFGGIWRARVYSAHPATAGVFTSTYYAAGVRTTEVGAQVARIENQTGQAVGFTAIAVKGTASSAYYAYEDTTELGVWTNWLYCVDKNSIERVKVLRNGSHRFAGGPIEVVVSGTAYTIGQAVAGCYLSCTNAAATTITIPTNVADPVEVGAVFLFRQGGAGQVTFSPDVGVTLNNVDSHTKTKGQYANVGLRKTDTNVWELFGSTAA